MKKAYIKISKKDMTQKELEQLTKIIDETGLKYFVLVEKKNENDKIHSD